MGVAKSGVYKVKASFKVFEGRELAAEEVVEVK